MTMKPQTPMQAMQLRKLFGDFNLKFFGSCLPAYSIRVKDHIRFNPDGSELEGRCLRERRLIEIQKGLEDQTQREVLLHEMIHVATGDDHGEAFLAEITRLQQQGAPLGDRDHKLLTAGTSKPVTVTEGEFTNHAEDCLMNNIKVTREEVVKLYIEVYGGAWSVAEFDRKYPWVRPLFRRLKAEAREEQKRLRQFYGEQDSLL